MSDHSLEEMERKDSKPRKLSLGSQAGSIDLSCAIVPDHQEDLQRRPIIKAGWLEKTPPHGTLIFQKRWVQLDAEYLRYFQNNKEVYSKKMISLSSVRGVVSSGDLKFEVLSVIRAFVFRAGSSQDRADWVRAIQELLGERGGHSSNVFFSGGGAVISKEGYLDMCSPKNRLYTVVSDDQVFLFRNAEEYQQGIGITSIDMKMGSVKDGNKKIFTLTTPYRTFSFAAESERGKKCWLRCLQECVSRSLSCDDVAQAVWSLETNRRCADCTSPLPEWASVNLCVLLCELCAGVHRSLGPRVSRVRSLKMDEHVWTNELIKVFLSLGNEEANLFWAANVPPSETLSPTACVGERQAFISSKYSEGKYRRYHPLYGQQQALNNALCRVVQTADLLESLSLLFCGAKVSCYTGVPECPTPLSLAQRSGQTLQAELLMQNQHTDSPQKQVKSLPVQTHSGHLFKVASSNRPITERKAKGEFVSRWCHFRDGIFRYYKNEKGSLCGEIKASDIICLAAGAPGMHGYEHTFEMYTEGGRMLLFAADDPNVVHGWIWVITKCVMPPGLGDTGGWCCERIGRLRCAEGCSGIGWFCLRGSRLQVLLQDTVQSIDLLKVHHLIVPDGSRRVSGGSLVLGWRDGTLHLEPDPRPHFPGWVSSIQGGVGGGELLSQQPLTDAGIPIIIHRCLDHITRLGLLSEGIYRKSGTNSRISALLSHFRHDARSVCLGEDFSVDDVANTLKRFLREVRNGVFGGQPQGEQWLAVTDIQDESKKISSYQSLLRDLPDVNRETLKTLVNHLICVQYLCDVNQMTMRNLGIVFGPTILQMSLQDRAGLVVEDLILHYCTIFNVPQEELQKQLDMTSRVLCKHSDQGQNCASLFQNALPKSPSCTIFAVYLDRKQEDTEILVQAAASITAGELVHEVLAQRDIWPPQGELWSCYEVHEQENMERLLHYQEKVIPLYFSLKQHCHLVVKRDQNISDMMTYLADRGDASKSGTLRVCEVKGDRSHSFSVRHCDFTETAFRMYKEGQNAQIDQRWLVDSLHIFQGCQSKLRPPTPWGLTLVCETQQWYLCCDNEDELIEWAANFMSIKYDGDIWPPVLVK